MGAASVTPVPWLDGAASTTGLPLDLVLHALAYAVLAGLLVRANVDPWVAVLAATTAGVGIEAIQLLVPYRSHGLLDVLANLAGALVGTVIAERLDTRRVET